MLGLIIKNSLVLSVVVFIWSTWGNFFAIFSVKPDIVLILIVWMGLHQGAFSSQFSGFIGGLIEDILSLSPIGFHSSSRTLTGFIFGSIRGYIGLDAIIVPILATITAFILQAIWFQIITSVFQIATAHSPLVSVEFVIGLFYTALISPVVFILCEFTSGRFNRLMKRWL